MTGAWPNLFIPGAAKAGTTSLHRYLAQHPDVFMSEEKEVHFFTERWEQAADAPRRLEGAKEAYKQRFTPGATKQVRGESTPAYLHHPDVPARIAECVPDARFLVILRDPIERAHSDYAMKVRLGHEDRPFLDVIEEELAATDRDEQFLIERGRYDEHLARYLDAFPRDQVRVLLFEDLKNDTARFLQDVLDHVGLDPSGIRHIDHETVHNPGGTPRNPVAGWLLTDERIHALARRIVPRRLRIWIGDHVLVEEGDKPPLESAAVEKLVPEFEPRVDRLESMLGRQLPELRITWPD